MIIPFRQLSHDALLALVEEFVTRDGTDYGEQEIPVAHRIQQVLRQLEQREAFILFDPDTSSCNIVSKADLPRDERGTDDENSGQNA